MRLRKVRCVKCNNRFLPKDKAVTICPICYRKAYKEPSEEELEEIVRYYKYIKTCSACGHAYGKDNLNNDRPLCPACLWKSHGKNSRVDNNKV